jgi:hypothetical protein
MHRLFVLAAATAVFVGLVAAPASADKFVIEDIGNSVYNSVNPCTGEDITTHYDNLNDKIRHPFLGNVQGSVTYMQKNVSVDAYTSDGYIGNVSSSRVENGNGFNEATNVMWTHPETGSKFRLKQNIKVEYLDGGGFTFRVLKVERRCITPAK